MAYTYTAWSVVFGEQPSASKWNIIGTNMASVDERIGSNFSSGTASPIWWEELDRDVLGVAGDTLSVSFTTRKFLRFDVFAQDTGGTIRALLRFNGDSGNNYSIRESTNGAADATTTSTSGLQMDAAAVANPVVAFAEVGHIAGDEKPVYGRSVIAGTAGAGNLPQRREFAGKWANTADAITSATVTNSGSGDYAIGATLVVRGHD